MWLTFTPVVRRFLLQNHPIEHHSNDDREQRKVIIDSYSVHERDARTKGIPILGSGRIFPVSEGTIMVAPFDIPDHWPRLGAMDFGWDHPFAAVELAWDVDQDTVYVNKAHRLREATPVVHAGAIRAWGPLPWGWPRDGRRETLEGAGIAWPNSTRLKRSTCCRTTYQHACTLWADRLVVQFSVGDGGAPLGVMTLRLCSLPLGPRNHCRT